MVSRWWAGLLAAVLLSIMACRSTPITSRPQLMLLTESEESSIGQQAYQEVLKKSEVSGDPVLNARVAEVGGRIAAATGRADYQWEFKVIRSDQVNAFCLPGGKVAVYTGILPIARDDAGLATILGHEVAHAVARHGGERASHQMGVNWLLGALAQGLSKDPAKAQQVIALLGAGLTVAVLLPWSRTQESEADHLGLIYMAKAGYHPAAASELWRRMERASQARQQASEFLSTHPAATTRIKEIDNWMPEAMAHYRPR